MIIDTTMSKMESQIQEKLERPIIGSIFNVNDLPNTGALSINFRPNNVVHIPADSWVFITYEFGTTNCNDAGGSSTWTSSDNAVVYWHWIINETQ